MAYTNRNFTWDFDSLKRFYEKYIVKWINSAVSWTEAQKKQARANLGFGDGDAIVTTADNARSDLDVADENGNVLMRLKDGHVKTKNFDSKNILDSNGTFRMIHNATIFNIDKASVAGSWTNVNHTDKATFELDASGHNGIWSLLDNPGQTSAVRMNLSSLENNKVYNISFNVSYTGDTTLARLNVTESLSSGKIEIVDYYSGKEVYIKNGHVEINIQKTSSWNYLYIFYGSIDTLTYPLNVTISNFLLYELKDVKYKIEELQQESDELRTDVSELQEMLILRSEVTPYDSITERIISSIDGSLLEVSSLTSIVKSFNIDPTKSYKASGRIGKTSDSCMIAYYNSNTFLGYEIASDGTAKNVVDYPLTVPNNATIVKIAGNRVYQNAELKLYEIASHLPQDVEELQQDVEELQQDVEELQQNTVIPQIIDNPIFRRTLSDNIKILCFGSSWFMNTWWYLNKITQSAGINAELHCYYMGHSQFVEWVELYKNDLTPLSGSEASRDASKNVSVNGANWIKTKFGSNYTAQQFRDDFYNDIISEDWDIIAFQQGARQAPYWDLYWKDSWSEIVEIVKTHCNPNTIIAFNSTWTPAVQDSAELSPWPATKEGQMGWQKANWDNTEKFMLLSGIYNVAPNGKTMYLLRDSKLNTETDFADDGLHPNNGLPMYALSGTWFETYLAPMFGISFKNVEWLPTTSTQKASVSKSTWTPISAEDSILIKSIISKALGCRFNF